MILRSKLFIGLKANSSPPTLTCSIARFAFLISSSRRLLRKPSMSSISQDRCPVWVCTARRLSACRAPRVRPSLPTSVPRFESSSSHDGQRCPTVGDVDVDIAVDIGQIQQLFEVVRGDLTLFLEDLGTAGLRRGLRLSLLDDVFDSLFGHHRPPRFLFF